jgi:hypothetical protein
LVHSVLAGAANANATLLGHILDEFDQFNTTLLGKFRNWESDKPPVARRGDPKLGLT